MSQPRLVLTRAAQPCCRGRRRAFTLVEVLATLVLVGIVLPVAMRGVTVAMRASSQSRQTSEAAQLAANKLSELVILQETTGSAGEFPEWPDYRWESTATQKTTGLYEIAVRVSWLSQGLEQSISLSTLMYPSSSASTSTSGSTSSGATP